MLPLFWLHMLRKDVSYGVIPLKQHHGSWEVFIVQHQAGHWGFPKGHAEEGETPQEAAARELDEETGLHVQRILQKEPLQENYQFSSVQKNVWYFLAEVKGSITLQQAELADGKWLPLKEAYEQMTFPEGKDLCRQVQSLLLGF